MKIRLLCHRMSVERYVPSSQHLYQVLFRGTALIASSQTTEDPILLQQSLPGCPFDIDHLSSVNIRLGRDHVKVKVFP